MMIKLWWLVWYFTRKNRPKCGNAPFWCKDEIERDRFNMYLRWNKHFCENWYSTLRTFYYTRISRGWPSETDQKEIDRIHQQSREIDDLIDVALDRGYLVKSGNNISITYVGRNFIKPLPFFNAALKEYSHIATFVVGIIGGGTIFIIAKWLIDLL